MTVPSALEPRTLSVQTSYGSYVVEVGTGLLPGVPDKLDGLLQGRLRKGEVRAFVVTSPEIREHWAAPLLAGFARFPQPPAVLEIPAGEEHKRFPTVERLAEQLAEAHADRDSVLLALGGGVIGDLTGFLAAIYMRGIAYVQIPTTALAQIDSSVGGKTGSNLAAGKNLLGAFHHPLAVFADLDTLGTLPLRELRAGLQEAIKAGIIRSAALFDFLELNADGVLHGDPAALQHVIAESVRIKADVVEADEREGHLRMILNMGHTLGHALEAATNYTGLLHGEAVGWGMIAAAHIAVSRALLSPQQADRICNLIHRYGPLPAFSATPERLIALTARDKKNRGGTRSFVLPAGIGDAVIVKDLTDAELYSAAALICREAAAAVQCA